MRHKKVVIMGGRYSAFLPSTWALVSGKNLRIGIHFLKDFGFRAWWVSENPFDDLCLLKGYLYYLESNFLRLSIITTDRARGDAFLVDLSAVILAINFRLSSHTRTTAPLRPR